MMHFGEKTNYVMVKRNMMMNIFFTSKGVVRNTRMNERLFYIHKQHLLIQLDNSMLSVYARQENIRQITIPTRPKQTQPSVAFNCKQIYLTLIIIHSKYRRTCCDQRIVRNIKTYITFYSLSMSHRQKKNIIKNILADKQIDTHSLKTRTQQKRIAF